MSYIIKLSVRIRILHNIGFCIILVIQTVKNLPAMGGDLGSTVGWEDPLEDGVAAHSSILAWRISMDRGAWRATVHGVSESNMTEQLSIAHMFSHYSECTRRYYHTLISNMVKLKLTGSKTLHFLHRRGEEKNFGGFKGILEIKPSLKELRIRKRLRDMQK